LSCAACHGADGRGTTPLFPNLHGQKAEYLAQQLRAFRDGKRQDPTMAPMAVPLSDQDIADLAAFYASLE
jgi:cytochrome c553